MAANTNPIFVVKPNSIGVSFVNADGTTKKTIFTAGTNGSRIFAVAVTSTDTVARAVDIFLNDGSTDWQLGMATVALGAGTVSGTPAVNLLDPNNIPGLTTDGSWFLPSGWLVKVAMEVAVTAAKAVVVISHGGDY